MGIVFQRILPDRQKVVCQLFKLEGVDFFPKIAVRGKMENLAAVLDKFLAAPGQAGWL